MEVQLNSTNFEHKIIYSAFNSEFPITFSFPDFNFV